MNPVPQSGGCAWARGTVGALPRMAQAGHTEVVDAARLALIGCTLSRCLSACVWCKHLFREGKPARLH